MITGMAREELESAIKRVFNERKYSVRSAYNGMSMTVSGNNDSTYVYFRITPFRNGKVLVDISNIELDESIQRKGYFTRLISEFKKTNCIDRLIIQNILSEEMAMACIKNKFVPSNYYNGYELVVNG